MCSSSTSVWHYFTLDSQQLNHTKKIQEVQFCICSFTCDLAMKWKLLTLAALVTAAVVLFSGKLFDIPTGREEESKEIVLVDIPSAAIPATPTAPETPSERPAWDPWANSDGSFDELKLARVPSANELLTPTFTKEEIEKIDREPHEGNGRTLMIMAFERTERSTKNVEFLINQVVGGRRAKDIDFIFVDTSKEGPYKCFPQLPNVMYVHRERVGFDICSYKVGLAIAPPGRYKYQGVPKGRYHLGIGQFLLATPVYGSFLQPAISKFSRGHRFDPRSPGKILGCQRSFSWSHLSHNSFCPGTWFS